MRLVEILPGLGLGGAERALQWRLSSRSRASETLVISTRPELRQLRQDVSKYAQVEEMPLSWRDVEPIMAVLREFQPHAVLTHSPLETIRLLHPGAPRLGVPVIPVVHGQRASYRRGLNHFVQPILSLANTRAAGFIAVSAAAALGKQSPKNRHVEVVHLGSHVNLRLQPLDLWPRDTSRRLLAVGRFVREKNFLELIRAIADIQVDLRLSHSHLLLVGHGPLESAIKSAIQSHMVGDLVTVVVDQTYPDALMLAADGLVISSTSEGGPLTAFEAAQVGMSIVSTPVGVVPQVIGGDTRSLLLADSSRKALSAGLQFLSSIDKLKADERLARQASARKWSADECSQEFYNAVGRILS